MNVARASSLSIEPVEIIEVGPRDGLQAEPRILPTPDKLALIQRLFKAGARRIEVASFVSPTRVPQMADAEGVLAGLREMPGLSRIGLVLNQRGLERAIAAGCDEIGLVAAATDPFAQANQGVDRATSIALCAQLAPLAIAAGMRVHITLSVAFGCPYAGTVPPDSVMAICRQLADLEPDELALADTIGVGVPTQVRQLFSELHEHSPTLRLRGHFHNTRNTALANIMAAYQVGVRRFDSSIGGVGGCPFAPGATGNVATEDVVYMLEHSGIRTGLDLPQLIETAKWLEQRLEHPLSGAVNRAGDFPTQAVHLRACVS